MAVGSLLLACRFFESECGIGPGCTWQELQATSRFGSTCYLRVSWNTRMATYRPEASKPRLPSPPNSSNGVFWCGFRAQFGLLGVESFGLEMMFGAAWVPLAVVDTSVCSACVGPSHRSPLSYLAAQNQKSRAQSHFPTLRPSPCTLEPNPQTANYPSPKSRRQGRGPCPARRRPR